MEPATTRPARRNAPPRKARRAPRSLPREVRKEPAFRSLLLALLAARLARPRTERCRVEVECYPGVPYHRQVLWKVALYAGVRLVPYRGGEEEPGGGAGRPRLRLFWPDSSALPRGGPPRPQPPDGWSRGALNGGARDASKRTVERAFAATFGYDLAVDPATHEGPCVAKSDRRNGAHDGRVLECPIAEADPALAYQRLVDNRADGGTVVDFRVPVVGGEMPFVYLKRRPLGSRFSNTNSAVAIAPAEAIFSDGEREGLRAFCRATGLDLAEVDVLRDAGDGRIYVVDVNRTPWGPPRPLPTAAGVRAVRLYAAALARLALRTAAAREAPDRPRPA